jgi:hypothetical protein
MIDAAHFFLCGPLFPGHSSLIHSTIVIASDFGKMDNDSYSEDVVRAFISAKLASKWLEIALERMTCAV